MPVNAPFSIIFRLSVFASFFPILKDFLSRIVVD
jgi:hypothetical protein